jgi:hypothetical protein
VTATPAKNGAAQDVAVQVSLGDSDAAQTDRVEETRQIVVVAMESLPAGFTVLLKLDIKTGRT